MLICMPILRKNLNSQPGWYVYFLTQMIGNTNVVRESQIICRLNGFFVKDQLQVS